MIALYVYWREKMYVNKLHHDIPISVHNNQTGCVDFLLIHGANPNHKAHDGKKAFFFFFLSFFLSSIQVLKIFLLWFSYDGCC
jgi:hypothetical protein